MSSGPRTKENQANENARLPILRLFPGQARNQRRKGRDVQSDCLQTPPLVSFTQIFAVNFDVDDFMESGTKHRQYEISTLLGKAGMGEVWRAKDTKLGCEVAIKTLPEEFAKDADRLKHVAIPVEESLRLALQIAEALRAERVIHRDLKPSNIKVAPEGKVKVLGFGLAKAFAGDGSDVNLSQSPTLRIPATRNETRVFCGRAD